MALTPIRDRQNTDPKTALEAFIKIVDAMNAAEQFGFSLVREAECGAASAVFHHSFEYGPYSIEWDSQAERWTLSAETDWAITVCSFNKPLTECTGFTGAQCGDCAEVTRQMGLLEADDYSPHS